jgi:hypothetical protein
VNNLRAEPIAGATVVELPYSVPVGAPFQKLFGPSRTTQHELIQQGEIESALVGDRRGRRVIFTQSYLDYLRRQQQKRPLAISVLPVQTPVHVNAAPPRSHRESLPLSRCERPHVVQPHRPHQTVPSGADIPAHRVE